MKLTSTPLQGAFVIEPELLTDERGFFARTFDASILRAQGLTGDILQQSISFNPVRGTLRGLHYQKAPHAEVRLIRCTKGSVFDVALDLRRESPTYRRWHGEELSAANRTTFYVPEGFAHGFLTLEDDTELFYQMSQDFHGPSLAGVRWNDPAFGISWPFQPVLLSDRDAHFADFDLS